MHRRWVDLPDAVNAQIFRVFLRFLASVHSPGRRHVRFLAGTASVRPHIYGEISIYTGLECGADSPLGACGNAAQCRGWHRIHINQPMLCEEVRQVNAWVFGCSEQKKQKMLNGFIDNHEAWSYPRNIFYYDIFYDLFYILLLLLLLTMARSG